MDETFMDKMDEVMETETEATEMEPINEETVMEVAPVEEVAPVAIVPETENVEEEKSSIGTLGIVGIVTGVAAAGYAGYRGVRWLVKKIKDSDPIGKIREKRLERAAKFVAANGFVVRPATEVFDEEPTDEEVLVGDEIADEER